MFNIPALAKNLVAIGFGLGQSVLRTVTIASGGTATYNPATDATTIAGAPSFQIQALMFDDFIRDPQDLASTGESVRVALIETAAIPTGRTIDRNATLTEPGGQQWIVDTVQQDPAGAITELRLTR